MSSSPIALLSDFGLSDVYVGVMKGAIAQIASDIRVIDLTHQIPPQNRLAARFCLLNAYRYFPPGTIFVAVVDPGVGSDRQGIAIQCDFGYLVGPDNGIFSGILAQSPAISAVTLSNAAYWRTSEPSTTFHGRDIFAPVGAYLAAGVPLSQIGNPLNPADLVELSLPPPQKGDREILGHIQYIDYFGNCITTIPRSWVQDRHWFVRVGDREIPGSLTYSSVSPGELVALAGSHGWVEIAANCGSARSQLAVDWLDAIALIY
ncbi:MAG: SAM-dependent chlorinase/fluorinase [Jaaginema sp. PMC 1079.18]|nr:SAM-dependent chlorinase/fluorinase [Jaaginema sp. PMC 1080.18]MEC4853876.1 SAM-dependent chlorinase/fluorinase [Jaaginema sp. PMC 1079.18]MEC4864528.1 SAM-dependent chlorinase/fluorinase [Jaaginema sp. PMC 1078.18]